MSRSATGWMDATAPVGPLPRLLDGSPDPDTGETDGTMTDGTILYLVLLLLALSFSVYYVCAALPRFLGRRCVRRFRWMSNDGTWCCCLPRGWRGGDGGPRGRRGAAAAASASDGADPAPAAPARPPIAPFGGGEPLPLGLMDPAAIAAVNRSSPDGMGLFRWADRYYAAAGVPPEALDGVVRGHHPPYPPSRPTPPPGWLPSPAGGVPLGPDAAAVFRPAWAGGGGMPGSAAGDGGVVRPFGPGPLELRRLAFARSGGLMADDRTLWDAYRQMYGAGLAFPPPWPGRDAGMADPGDAREAVGAEERRAILESVLVCRPYRRAGEGGGKDAPPDAAGDDHTRDPSSSEAGAAAARESLAPPPEGEGGGSAAMEAGAKADVPGDGPGFPGGDGTAPTEAAGAPDGGVEERKFASEEGALPVRGNILGVPETTCPICLDEFEEGELLNVTSQCPHAFHRDCLLPWLERHTVCPCCRAVMVSEEEWRDASRRLRSGGSGAASGPRARVRIRTAHEEGRAAMAVAPVAEEEDDDGSFVDVELGTNAGGGME